MTANSVRTLTSSSSCRPPRCSTERISRRRSAVRLELALAAAWRWRAARSLWEYPPVPAATVRQYARYLRRGPRMPICAHLMANHSFFRAELLTE
jgi:hypothetical protein